ncbi:hypothetical protein FACS1894166_02230 [Bacilli bacterium]|nr:hypothetical protein FACS1894166_02230 [Bacilli bacterium]
MYKIYYSDQFKLDYKYYLTHKKDAINELEHIIKVLASNQILNKKYCDHFIAHGKWSNFRECHVQND